MKEYSDQALSSSKKGTIRHHNNSSYDLCTILFGSVLGLLWYVNSPSVLLYCPLNNTWLSMQQKYEDIVKSVLHDYRKQIKRAVAKKKNFNTYNAL